MNFGPVIGGTPAHRHNFFPTGEIPVTREKIVIRQKFGILFWGNGRRYSYQIFTTYDPWGSPYNAIEISTLTPKNFEKLGENFFGGGVPQGP